MNKRRVWATRLELEASCHQVSLFVTLTYSEHNVPRLPSGLLTLRRRDAKLFLMRLRKHLGYPYRYFLVGEYGDTTERPHYHAILFGVPDPQAVQSCWQLGGVHVGLLGPGGAEYCAGYCVKKLTAGHKLLAGREPEYAVMSRKPGIGALVGDEIGKWLAGPAGREYLAEKEDLPRTVKVDGKDKPLGRYIRERAMKTAGLLETEGLAPSETFKGRLAQIRGEQYQQDLELLGREEFLRLDSERRVLAAHKAARRARRRRSTF